jgi:peptidoglycan/xylan/chitin deacetylase (PgdA/CDA1 family)
MERLKSFARCVMVASGACNVARKLSSHLPRIIMYHRFCGPDEDDPACLPVNIFRRQVEYLKKYYVPMKLCELVDARMRDGVYPNRSVVITVDDGYANFFRWAFPVLREFEMPATVFVVTDLLDRNGWIWTDQFRYLCQYARSNTALSEKKQRSLLQAFKRLPLAERQQRLSELAEQAKVCLLAEAPPRYALMSWEQLRVIADSGLIEIASHTRTHPILAYVNAEDSWEELHTSRLEIQEQLGVSVHSFSYPNGLPGDYRLEHMEMLSHAGYGCATASHPGYVTARSNIFALPRLSGNKRDMNRFRKYLDGVQYFLSRRSSGSNGVTASSKT